jgi:hypothetical protein
MMKKFLRYILILVLASIFFINISSVNAEDPKGTCYKNAGETIGTNITKKKCLDKLPDGLGGETWGPSTPILSDGGVDLGAKYKACISDGGAEVDCRSYINSSSSSVYHLLEPLPCKEGTPNCEPGGSLTEFDTKGTGQLGTYLNLGITLFIGLCAVAAVVMITIAGIEYSTAELVSNKAAAKDKIQNALLGLLLALCSWLILNTINPDLLRTDFEISGVELGVTYIPSEYVLSASQTIDGKPGKVISFSKEACPAAKIAEAATGVDRALILAIFSQESAGGRNTGSCNYNNAGMGRGQLACLKRIAPKIGRSIESINMSCGGSAGGNGGAMGVVQFIPCTYEENLPEATRLLGHAPNPWLTSDAFTLAAVKLKRDGGIQNPYGAACKYFGKCSNTVDGKTVYYANNIVAKMNAIKSQNKCP